MKISEINQIALNKEDSQLELSDKIKSEKIFAADFDANDGLAVNKAGTKPNEDSTTYTKISKDKNGNPVVSTYDSKDDSILFSETKFSYGYTQKDFYTKGTTIINKSQEFNTENKLLSEKTFYDSAPYSLKQRQEFDTANGEVKTDYTYDKNDSENHSGSKIYSGGKLIEKMEEDEDAKEYINYRKDGSIQAVRKEFHDGALKFTESRYRKDGTLYSEADNNLETVYERNGKVSQKKYTDDENQNIVERYGSDGKLYVKEVYTASRRPLLKERTVLNKDGSEYLKTTYGEKGEILDYVKNERIGDKKYDKFKENNLDGKIDTTFKQGKAGTCYLASTIQSFMLTEKGKEIISDSLEYEEKTGLSTVKFNGVGKEYSFSKDEIKKAMGRLGTGDPDFTAMVMGYEEYRAETKGKIVDGGLGNEVMEALCGKSGENNILFGSATIVIDNKVLDNLQKQLKKGNSSITAGTPKGDEDNEFSAKDEKAGLTNNHSYAVSKITDENVYVINPTTQKTIKLTREKFMDTFQTYCSVELK